jgi:hypothetical protein
MADGFLNRWSQRKAGKVTPEPATKSNSSALKTVPDAVAEAKLNVDQQNTALDQTATLPQLTLDDVAKLNHQDDFSVFMQSGVDPDVKRAAMKKLFSDPRYNIMDGLDIYIDDYSKPDPIPPEMLRRLVQSQMLNLFKTEEEEKDKPNESAAEQIALESPDNESSTSLPLESKVELTEIQPSKPPLDPQLKT